MLPSFPKIFALGTVYIKDIFDGLVEITEKVDGSQISFGKIGGVLYIRSKSSELYSGKDGVVREKMFQPAIDYLRFMEPWIPDNIIFYGEYLSKPKHNVLNYERPPKNNIILFGCARYPEMGVIDMHTFSEYLEIGRAHV